MPYFITPSGNRLYYERHGESGPVVILLHGLASSTRIWFRQKKALRHRFQVYLLDFPGHGRSDPLPQYSIAEFSQMMKWWMDHCRIEQAHLVALSLGCSVALTLAAEYPERVKSLILSGPVGGYHSVWSLQGLWDWLLFKLFPLLTLLSAKLFGTHQTAHWLNAFGVQAKSTFKLLETIQNKADLRAIRQLLWDSIHPPYVDRLEGVTAPVMIIRGVEDPTPLRFTRYILDHLPQAYARECLVEIPLAHHIVSLEKPLEFNRLMLRFLKTGIIENFQWKGEHEDSA